MSYSSFPRSSVQACLAVLRSVWRTVAVPGGRAIAFWLAVCLPWALLVFVFAGYASQYPGLVAVLVTGCVVSAILGQGYTHR